MGETAFEAKPPSRPVQLWLVEAAASERTRELCLASLTEGERARAGRMRPGTARDEFVTGRAALRGLLGAALGVRPWTLALAAGPQGKPSVQGATFNVAHARGLIGIAMCVTEQSYPGLAVGSALDARPVPQLGLDLEHVDAGREWREIAESHFTPAEMASITRSRAPERRFCEIWTHKEAALKATGLGLTVDLAHFDVSSVAVGEPRPVSVAGYAVYLQPVDLGDQWCCSVATVGVASDVAVRWLEDTALAELLLR